MSSAVAPHPVRCCRGGAPMDAPAEDLTTASSAVAVADAVEVAGRFEPLKQTIFF